VPGEGDRGLDAMRLIGMLREVMTKSYNWDETVRVMARLFFHICNNPCNAGATRGDHISAPRLYETL
jgi:hypothetical protein